MILLLDIKVKYVLELISDSERGDQEMPRLMKVSIEEAKGMKRKYIRKAEKLKQYKRYITDLAPNESGKFKIQNDKEGFAVRANLKRAADALGLNVHIQKRENHIFFWKEQ